MSMSHSQEATEFSRVVLINFMFQGTVVVFFKEKNLMSKNAKIAVHTVYYVVIGIAVKGARALLVEAYPYS